MTRIRLNALESVFGSASMRLACSGFRAKLFGNSRRVTPRYCQAGSISDDVQFRMTRKAHASAHRHYRRREQCAPASQPSRFVCGRLASMFARWAVIEAGACDVAPARPLDTPARRSASLAAAAAAAAKSRWTDRSQRTLMENAVRPLARLTLTHNTQVYSYQRGN